MPGEHEYSYCSCMGYHFYGAGHWNGYLQSCCVLWMMLLQSAVFPCYAREYNVLPVPIIHRLTYNIKKQICVYSSYSISINIPLVSLSHLLVSTCLVLFPCPILAIFTLQMFFRPCNLYSSVWVYTETHISLLLCMSVATLRSVCMSVHWEVHVGVALPRCVSYTSQ